MKTKLLAAAICLFTVTSGADFSINDTATLEGDTGTNAAVFTIWLSRASALTVSVDFQTTNDDPMVVGWRAAVAGSDYLATSGTVVFSPGVTTQYVLVPILGDQLNEWDERFFVNLFNPTNALIAGSRAIGTILDDDPLPHVTFGEVTLAEGDSGTTNLAVFIATLWPPSGRLVSLLAETADGSARAGVDYLQHYQPLVFPPGETNQAFVVEVLGNRAPQADRTFRVVLTSAPTLILDNNSVTGTILDDDPGIEFDSNLDLRIAEDAGTFEVNVHRLNFTNGTANVTCSTQDGTATAGEDFLAFSTTLTFAPGETLKHVPVTILNDGRRESACEDFQIVLSGFAGGSPGENLCRKVIVADNDPGPSFQSGSYQVSEADNFATITVRRGDDWTNAVIVAYSTSDGTATAGADYVATSGTLTFAAGETEKFFAVPLLNNARHEGRVFLFKFLSLTLMNLTADTPDSYATLFIADNDPGVQFSSPQYSVWETGGVVTVTVLRGDDLGVPFRVDYFTSNLTATVGQDYVETRGTLNFGAGQSNATVTLRILDDALEEGTEMFTLVLDHPAGSVSLGDIASTVIRIRDDEAPRSRWLDGSQALAVGGTTTFAVQTNGTLWAAVPGNEPTMTMVGGDDDWAAVSADSRRALALKTDGSLWEWFSPEGTGVPILGVPTLLGADPNWVAISARDDRAAAIKRDGSLWVWGSWYAPDGTGVATNRPTRFGQESDWSAVTLGGSHSIALKRDRSLWAWGGNSYGQLGTGDQGEGGTNVPVRIGGLDVWMAISAGADHSLALKCDGTLWSWGANGYGQLGNGTYTPGRVPGQLAANKPWMAIAAGGDGSVGLQSDGSLWAWGVIDSWEPTPNRIGSDNEWTAIASGGYPACRHVCESSTAYSVGLKADGSLWVLVNGTPGPDGDPQLQASRIGTSFAWGSPINPPRQPLHISRAVSARNQVLIEFAPANPNAYYILYRGASASAIDTPVALDQCAFAPQLMDPAAPATMAFYRVREVPLSQPLDLDGDGIDDVYELRHTRFLNALNPADAARDFDRDGQSNLQEYLVGTNPARLPALALGDGQFLKTNGTLWGWTCCDGPFVLRRIGSNNDNVGIFPGNFVVTAQDDWIVASTSFTGGYSLAIRSDGSLWAGPLGIGTNGEALPFAPGARVGTNSDWFAVAAATHSVGIRADGSLWAWGDNWAGQLGIGTNDAGTNVPIRIGTGHDWVAVDGQKIEPFEPYTLALKADGTLWAWGSGTSGQLGFGTNQQANGPTRIGSDSDWRCFSAGGYHAAAIKTDGSIWAWGSGASSFASVPTRIGTDTTWLAVAAGAHITMGLKTDGTLWRLEVGQPPEQIGTDSDWGLPP